MRAVPGDRAHSEHTAPAEAKGVVLTADLDSDPWSTQVGGREQLASVCTTVKMAMMPTDMAVLAVRICFCARRETSKNKID